MHRPSRNRLLTAGVAPLLVGVALLLPAALHAQTPVIQQQTTAKLNWKKAFDKDDPPHAETEHLLLYGTVPGKNLKEIGETLEKQFELARKVLTMDPKRDMWMGKLTVFLIPEKADYAKFIRRVEKRYPEEGELGSTLIRSDEPHVVAGPPASTGDPSVEEQAGEQMAMALLQKKMNLQLPSWIRHGFGRATVLQTAPAVQQAAERTRVLSLVTQKKRKAADAWGNSLEPDEAPALWGSVIGYLAYSGRTSKFMPFLQALVPSEDRPEPTTADALKAVEIAPDRLHTLWLAWVRAPKG